MGKKTKTSSIVALATTPSTCAFSFRALGGYNNCVQYASTLAHVPLEGLQAFVTQLFDEGIKGERRAGGLDFNDLSYLIALEYATDIVAEIRGGVAGGEFEKAVFAGLVAGRTLFIERTGIRNVDDGLPLLPGQTEAEAQQFIIKNSLALCRTLLAWQWAGQHTYIVTPTLAELLSKTNIRNFSMSDIKMPFKAVEFVLPLDIHSWLGRADRSDGRKIDPIKHISLLAHEYRDSNTIQITEVVLSQYTSQCVTRFPLNRNELLRIGEVMGHENILADKANAAHQIPYVDQLLNFVVALLIYTTLPDADMILGQESLEYKAWIKSMKRRKKLSKKERRKLEDAESSNRCILGSSIKILDRHDYNVNDDADLTKTSGPTRKSPETHWRQGHMRTVRVGPRNGPQTIEPRWIQPTMVAAPPSGAVPQPKKTVMR